MGTYFVSQGALHIALIGQSCLTLCDPMDCSIPGLPVPHHLPEFARSYSLHPWCCPAISSSDALFSFCPQSFPAQGAFPMSRLFISDDQNIGASASASVLAVKIMVDLPWDWLVWSLCCPRDLQESSSTTIQRHQFFGGLPYLHSSSHNCMWPLGGP